MNREIKFRAWDGEFMIKWENLKEITLEELNLNLIDNREVPVEQMDIEVMQYTGLKDFNGFEIYEGDLFVRTSGYYKVVWHRSGWAKETQSGNFLDIDEDDEIIGNEFENPELMETK
jgi:hypothetical protein